MDENRVDSLSAAPVNTGLTPVLEAPGKTLPEAAALPVGLGMTGFDVCERCAVDVGSTLEEPGWWLGPEMTFGSTSTVPDSSWSFGLASADDAVFGTSRPAASVI